MLLSYILHSHIKYMRQQIRLVISPAQINGTIQALQKVPAEFMNRDAQSFLRYLQGKQVSVMNGETAIAYLSASTKADKAFNNGTASNNLVDAINVMDHILTLTADKDSAYWNRYSYQDKVELHSFATVMGMPLDINKFPIPEKPAEPSLAHLGF